MFTQYPVTQYELPDGRRTEHELGIFSDDAKWFKEHDAKLSFERLRSGQCALYASLPELEALGAGEAVKIARSIHQLPIDFKTLRKVTEELLAHYQHLQAKGK